MAKQKYDSYYFSKRIEQLISMERLSISDVEMRIAMCDPDYIDEIIDEANEILPTLKAEAIKLYATTRDILPDSSYTFIEYAETLLSKMITHKMKLTNDECVSSVIVKHERNIHN